MRLPETPDGGMEIGISDLLDWRECPARMKEGMRRHTEAPVPGETDWRNAYGSAIHDAIHLVETQGMSNQDAVTAVWPTYAGHLDPDDLALLNEDLDRYRGDTPLGMELVAAEANVRVPLFVHEGKWVYFRFKLDALYRRSDDHTVFFQRDYKSSKWRRTQSDVDEDPQMWAYNYGIHELYPECASLIQSYEMLRFGNLLTGKNEEQRRRVKAWLVDTTKAVLEDETLAPRQNDFCPWCPLVITCDETQRSNRVWRSKLALLAPMTKEGRKTKIALSGEGLELEEMIAEELPSMIRTLKHLEKAIEAMKVVVEQMPSEERERLGWRISERKTTYLPPDALRALAEAVGPSIWEALSLSKTAAEKVLGKPELEMMKQLALEKVASSGITRT